MTTDPAELNFEEPRKRVGVIVTPTGSVAPASYGSGMGSDGSGVGSGSLATQSTRLESGQERMLSTLERVFPIRFEQVHATDLNGLDGVLMLGSGALESTPVDRPRLVLPSEAPTPPRDFRAQSGVADGAVVSGPAFSVVLADGPDLARPLRGHVIPERAIAGALPAVPAGASVLGHVEGRPVWWQIGDAAAVVHASAYPLAELCEEEPLRDQLRAGCFMGLLPLIHFLGQILGGEDWTPPPLRASFVVDDPNLHWPSYGFLEYGQLAEHAARHGYHVGLATVPLDGWRADRRARSLLANSASVLSLLMHGNNHIAEELGRLSSDAEAESAIAQALRRIGALEHRSGLSVNRVMTPPHGACSEAALRAMFRLGMEAVSVTPPYPWREGLPASTPFTGWHPVELVAGGLPVLPRHHLDDPREDLALRAMLGQPLILYGHHEDFAQGLDILAQASSEIDRLGDVQWGPLGQIARSSYATRRLGEMLLVRMHSRRISIEVPAGVRELRIVLPEPHGGAAGHRLAWTGGSVNLAFDDGLGVSEPLAVDAPTRIDLTLVADRPLTAAEVPSPRVRLWPPVRRAIVEGRDRLQALG